MAHAQAWKDEAGSFLRAFSGAYLIGMPLLFTMEMWWIGRYSDLWTLGAFLALIFIVDLYLASMSGFKNRRLLRSIDQAVDSVAVGLAASAVVLITCSRITLATPIESAVGMIIAQAGPLSIGAAIANSILGPEKPGKQQQENEESPGPANHEPWRATGRVTGATIAGGLFLGLAIAPTQEIPMLAAGMTGWHSLGLVVLTLIVSYIIVFQSDFSGDRGQPHYSFIRHPSTETLLSYGVALLVSLAALYLFDHIGAGDPAGWVVSQMVVLALPVSIGGAAGRLIT